MLASITPLGERGRHSTWTVTVTSFLIGATAAGAGAGALLGGAGELVVPHVGVRPRLVILAVGLVVAIALEALPTRVPGPRRQVNERWLDEYRGWLYGVGFGAQLGLGMITVVSSAATYVAALTAFLAGNVARGAIILGCFGAVRGLTPLAAAHVRDPRALIAVHLALDRWRRPLRWASVAALIAILLPVLAGSLG